jgi:hypothetical protein
MAKKELRTEEEGLILFIPCPYLKRVVKLKKDTWFYKIIQSHQEVSNRLDLITDILSKDGTDVLRFRKKRDRHKIALFKKCPHLLPYNQYIKIALHLISDDEAIVTTVQGKSNLPSLADMEEIT